ncbi:hypothetical protein HLB44_35870 [Aquincola sp. S2]|uniref:Uncharacterized protein n=2 Tax=Pseudaquabacterium terrae TaxID=2732868 RepID=A0ABX2EVB5_9BURK|nr:hypothetical protein [Aquabacterium terrae]
MTPAREDRSGHRLRFRSLFRDRHDLTFPCDPAGRVDIGLLGRRALNQYLFARAVVGRLLLAPVVEQG